MKSITNRRKKNLVVMALAVMFLGVTWVTEGLKMTLITIGLGIALVCFWAFIGWFHDD